jgi:hypothetical protein
VASKWIDSLKAQGYELHWFASGFPKKEPVTNQDLNYWELLAGLKQLQLNEGIIFSFSKIAQFNGKRESMPKNIRWITLSAPPHDYTAVAFQKSINDYIIRTGSYANDMTNFATHHSNIAPVDGVKVSALPKLKIIISYDKNYQRDAALLKSMILTISEVLPIEISVAENQLEKQEVSTCDWLFLLSTSNKPLVDSTKVVTYRFNDSQEFLHQINSHNWCLSQRISFDNVRKENLLIKLALLFTDQQEISQNVLVNDVRTLPDSLLFSGSSSNFSNNQKEEVKIDLVLFIAFLLLLIFERILSFRKRQ